MIKLDRGDHNELINFHQPSHAAASVEMEGFRVTAQHKELCRKLLNKEITKAEYIRQITEAAKGQ